MQERLAASKAPADTPQAVETIAHVVAIDVGSTEFVVQVLNNIVLVIPSFNINWIKTITEAEQMKTKINNVLVVFVQCDLSSKTFSN